MPVLVETSRFSWPCYLSGRDIYRSYPHQVHPWIPNPHQPARSEVHPRISGLLPQVCWGILKHRKASYPTFEEGSEVHLVRQMWSQLPGTEKAPYYHTYYNYARCDQWFRGLLRCLQTWTWVCPYARGQSDFLLVATTPQAWAKLPNPWPRACCGGPCTQNMAAFSDGQPLRNLHRSQEPEVHLHPEGLEHKAVKMDRTHQGLWLGHPLPPWKS